MQSCDADKLFAERSAHGAERILIGVCVCLQSTEAEQCRIEFIRVWGRLQVSAFGCTVQMDSGLGLMVGCRI